MQQIPDDVGQAPRFLHLLIQEDLLEGWQLVREMGYQGKSGRVRRNHFEDYSEAIQAMLKERDTQIKRGYRVVFVEGQHHE
ncbi:MAG: WGR domain-containing protein [Sulfuriflexus sp.]|nr:WGR domain-containing protein [Sulfuriflexus sp.]